MSDPFKKYIDGFKRLADAFEAWLASPDGRAVVEGAARFHEAMSRPQQIELPPARYAAILAPPAPTAYVEPEREPDDAATVPRRIGFRFRDDDD